MSAESKATRPAAIRQDPLRPTERAFVVQFDPIAGARSRLRGRVELVASAEATRFRSVKQLVAFMVDTLRRPEVGEVPR